MKLFSSFDTQLCEVQYAEMCEEHGEAKVLFIRRDVLYLWIKVYWPLFWWVTFSAVMMILLYSNTSGFWVTLGWIVAIILGIGVGYIAINKRIDRWMDYTIITPRQVIQYDQTGMLKRSTRTLDLAKVKSINIKKDGLMTSIFNLGDIVFFSEGDAAYGDIRLNYIKRPIILKEKITKIMEEALSARQSANQESRVQQEM